MKSTLKDVTAVCPNWLTARRTLGSVTSFKRFYPDVPLIIVDDHSSKEYESLFFGYYKNPAYRPDIIYDPDNSKLKKFAMENNEVTYLGLSAFTHPGKGHGRAVQEAFQLIETKWAFHMDSDTRITQPGLIEHMLKEVNKLEEQSIEVGAVGMDKSRMPGLPNLHNTFAMYNLELANRYQLSFKQILWDTVNEQVVGYFPEDEDDIYGNLTQDAAKNIKPLETGTEIVGMLSRKGYPIIRLNGLSTQYGVHLRYVGDNKDEEWSRYY
jgi:glycosyltransferase involved in cell wall biosynthesis